jgi:hypothetical protein
MRDRDRQLIPATLHRGVLSQAALFVACLSLVVSGLALGWQVAMWLLNGGRVRTQLMHPVKLNGHPLKLTSLQDQGWSGPEVLGVQVTNTGRARVQVTAFGIRQGPKGIAANYPSGNAYSPGLPVWIEAGSSETWYAELQDGAALIYAAKQGGMRGRRELRMSITLGTGRTIVTRRRLQMK